MSVCLCLSVCLSVNKISLKRLQPINFILMEFFPMTEGRIIILNFQKNRPGVSVGVGGPTFGGTNACNDKI